MFRELEQMLDPLSPVFLGKGIKTHYEGSIDKAGGNADWDWNLYRDDRGEYVLFEHYGPGCIFNFVQHRYIQSTEPTFRFYFDGEEEPRFVIRPSQFGEKYPFLAPLADKFIGPLKHSEKVGDYSIRVIRSFVPMPFRSYCRITSDIELLGNSVETDGGGWGHVVFQEYADAEGCASFDPSDRDYRKLQHLWQCIGKNPLKTEKAKTETLAGLILRPGERKRVYCRRGAGLITSIRCNLADYDRRMNSNLRVEACWDNHREPDLAIPLGAFFGNELGYHPVSYLMMGSDGEGGFYQFYPMPFFRSAEIVLENRGDAPVTLDWFAVSCTEEYNERLASGEVGFFRSGKYHEIQCTHAADSVIGELTGHGNVVASVISAYSMPPLNRADCEGDARIHFDDIRTPQIESDGSESYSCYGWGFCSPPQCNPVSGYDGELQDVHENWSMVRCLPGDFYPFQSGVHFGIESCWCNDADMLHSGAVFYYGRDEIALKNLGTLSIGDPDSECAFAYRSEDESSAVSLSSFFEGDEDDREVILSGHYAAASRFVLTLPEGTKYLILRRVSDQAEGRQYAEIRLNGERLPFPWYFADHNPIKRWLEDEYTVPVEGLRRVEIEVLPQSCGGRISWNEFEYSFYAL